MALSGAVLFSVFIMPASASGSGSGGYVVKPGDTLGRIAGKQGLGSWRPLFDANPSVKNPNLIFPGQRLVIPGDVIPGDGAKASRSSQASSKHWQRSSVQRHHAPGVRHSTSGSTGSSSSRQQNATSAAASGTVWDRLAQCESGGNWSINTGNGFYGGLQFTQSSWRAAGGSGSPQNASRATQISVAKRLQQMQGWGAWPSCSRKVGLR